VPSTDHEDQTFGSRRLIKSTREHRDQLPGATLLLNPSRLLKRSAKTEPSGRSKEPGLFERRIDQLELHGHHLIVAHRAAKSSILPARKLRTPSC
jgi:hypothetical protein